MQWRYLWLLTLLLAEIHTAIPELVGLFSYLGELKGTVEEHDLVSVAEAFGESFLYYTKRNPASAMEERKVTFVKRIVSFGLPILIGAGYYLDEGP